MTLASGVSRADRDLTIRAINAWKAIKGTSSTHILLSIPNTKSFMLILITIYLERRTIQRPARRTESGKRGTKRIWSL
jgi:hypothetical protein